MIRWFRRWWLLRKIRRPLTRTVNYRIAGPLMPAYEHLAYLPDEDPGIYAVEDYMRRKYNDSGIYAVRWVWEND